MEHTPAPYPVRVTIPRQERYSRLLALATLLFMVPKLILVIPHLVIVYVLSFVCLVLGLAAQIVVLLTGRYPESLFAILEGFVRWKTRVNCYLYGLTDQYPPFRMRDEEPLAQK